MSEQAFEVVVAGGGVAALEAVLAIRAAESPPVSVTLLAPSREFRLQAMSVAEPFGGDAPKIDLAGFCVEHDVTYRQEAIAEVWGGPQRILTDRGEEVFYDALLLATGARRASALPGSHPFRGAADVKWFGTLLERLDRGAIADVIFAVPRQVKWSLPAWEMALLTTSCVVALGTQPRRGLLPRRREDSLFPGAAIPIFLAAAAAFVALWGAHTIFSRSGESGLRARSR